MKRGFKIFIIVLAGLFSLSCSTTRVLQDNEYRLAKNKVKVINDKRFNAESLLPYIKQKENSYFIFGWNPSLNVYNWQNGKGKGWDKFVQSIGVEPVVYNSELVDKSIENIENHLEYIGYYDSKVTSEIRVKRKLVKVKYNVELGKRYTISDISLSLPPDSAFCEAFLADTANITIKKGDYLSEAALASETQRSASVMRNNGFFTFNSNYYFFEADTLANEDSAKLTMSVKGYTRNENPKDARPINPFYINDVSISYPASLKIRESVLKNLNIIKPGELYSEEVVNRTYSRLTSLRIFSSVNIEMTPKDSNKVNCLINLSQSKMQGFKVNLEGSINSTGLFGISPQLSYYHKNIFRGGELLSLGFMGNFQFKPNQNIKSTEFGVSTGLTFPGFLGLPKRYFKETVPRTDFNVSYNFQQRPEYTRNIISTAFGYTGQMKRRLSYQLYALKLNIVRLFNLDQNFYNSLMGDPFMRNAYQNHFDLGAAGTLYYTTNPESRPQTNFFYTRLQSDLAGNVLSIFKSFMEKDNEGAGMIWNTPYSQYLRAEATIGKTWFFGKKSNRSLATRFVIGAGYAYGNSTVLPFEKHFYAGGANSLRGWQARSVGPGLAPRDATFVIPNQTGDMRMEANIEYRFSMFWKFAGAIFADAGNIWTLENRNTEQDKLSMLKWSTFGDSIAANWGLGLRLDFGFLLLRLDCGFKVHDPVRDYKWLGPREWFKRDGSALHFGVGYPF